MATYNKRGYKAPKPEGEKVENVNDIDETINIDEKDSTTAGVFNTLDETASKTEEFIAKNQNIILSIVGGIALITAGYLLYNKFVSGPKQNEAASDMFQAQQYFKQAVEGTVANDSLYNLALNGGEGKQGFLDIIESNGSTDAGNLAQYYAGMAFLNTKQFQKAIDHLSQFKSDDAFTNAIAIGAIGDANAELKKPEQALEFYIKAAESAKNEMTTPRFLLKAGQTAMTLGKKADALKYFTEIKDNFDTAPEAQNIDALIGMAQ
jgi:tetratricopeptide (TPR) repeat protein